PYMILLNSDTVVKENWDKAMIAYLEENPKVAETGYLGGILNDQGLPMSKDLGPDIDYIAGYCLCISRESYDKYGLFDDGLKFAYFEDFDLSIRLKEKGRKLYALHLDLVIHYEGKTVKAVSSTEEDKESLAATFEQNRLYFQNKWKEYLKWKRVAAGKG
ncbi:MAG: glycosyltransferase family 2 protein, partial [bacterium]|nr:glycosyltransferase family 2 protein [bacterium]